MQKGEGEEVKERERERKDEMEDYRFVQLLKFYKFLFSLDLDGKKIRGK